MWRFGDGGDDIACMVTAMSTCSNAPSVRLDSLLRAKSLKTWFGLDSNRVDVG